jgi:hypothetical protein
MKTELLPVMLNVTELTTGERKEISGGDKFSYAVGYAFGTFINWYRNVTENAAANGWTS